MAIDCNPTAGRQQQLFRTQWLIAMESKLKSELSGYRRLTLCSGDYIGMHDALLISCWPFIGEQSVTVSKLRSEWGDQLPLAGHSSVKTTLPALGSHDETTNTGIAHIPSSNRKVQ